MPRYVAPRTFPEGVKLPASGDGTQLCRVVVERNREEDVTWVQSLVSEDKRRSFCVYDAPNPEAIRRTAGRERPARRPNYLGPRARPVLQLLGRPRPWNAQCINQAQAVCSSIGREWRAPRQRLHMRGLATATEMQPEDHHATLAWVAALRATARPASCVTASRGLPLLTATTSRDL